MLVGVLALQGSFAEHLNIVKKLNVNAILVKTLDDLNQVDGLIIPGGESTTIGKLLKIFNLFDPLKEKIMKHTKSIKWKKMLLIKDGKKQ